MACNFTISKSAAAELLRQSAFGGTLGEMYIDLLPDGFNEGWLYIKLRCGKGSGSPIARTDGITLFASEEQMGLFDGLSLDYYGDLSGGGFLISPPEGAKRSPCGSGFKMAS